MKIARFVLCLLVFYIPLSIVPSQAQETPPPAGLAESSIQGMPGASSPSITSSENVISTISRILLFLGILAASGYGLLWYTKKAQFPLGFRKKEGNLEIKETHMLGNKQFLVVVEYGEQKMLLGVSPGMIRHLCYLNTPYDDAKALWKEANEALDKETD